MKRRAQPEHHERHGGGGAGGGDEGAARGPRRHGRERGQLDRLGVGRAQAACRRVDLAVGRLLEEGEHLGRRDGRLRSKQAFAGHLQEGEEVVRPLLLGAHQLEMMATRPHPPRPDVHTHVTRLNVTAPHRGTPPAEHLATDGGQTSPLQGLHRARPLADDGGHLLDGEVADDAQEQHLALVGHQALDDLDGLTVTEPGQRIERRRPAPRGAAPRSARWPCTATRRRVRRRSSMRLLRAMVNTQARNWSSSPVKRSMPRKTRASTSFAEPGRVGRALRAEVGGERLGQGREELLEGAREPGLGRGQHLVERRRDGQRRGPPASAERDRLHHARGASMRPRWPPGWPGLADGVADTRR